MGRKGRGPVGAPHPQTHEREEREAREREADRSGGTAEREAVRALESTESRKLLSPPTPVLALCPRPIGLVSTARALLHDRLASGELGRPGRPAPAGDWPEPARGQDAEGGSEGDLEGRPSSEQADDDSDGRTQGPSSGDPHGGAGGDVPRRTWQRGLAVPSQPKDSGREDRGDVRGRSWQRGFTTPSQPGEVGYPQRRSEFRSQGHAFEQTGNVRGAGVPTPVDSSIEDPYRFSRLREVAWDRFLLKSESLAAAHRLPPGGSGRVARIVRGLADAMRRKRKR